MHAYCHIEICISLLQFDQSTFWRRQTKDYKVNICCFNTKHVALSSKSKRLGIRIMCSSDITSFVNLCSANKCVKFMWKQYMYSYSCIPNIENYPVITCWTMMIITHAIMHIHELLYCLVTYNLFSIFQNICTSSCTLNNELALFIMILYEDV